MIIGLSGLKNSGKSTVAGYLSANGYKEFSFAQPLKNIVKYMFILSEEQVNGNKKEDIDYRWYKTPRQLMQSFGTEYVRDQIDKDFWVKRLEIELDEYQFYHNIVISDVRFENEREFIKKKGGIVIRINRLGCVSDGHPSETQNFDVDYTVDNNGTEKEMCSKVRKIINHILTPSTV